MRSALLPLTPNSNPSAEDHEAKELAQQINFKVKTAAATESTFDLQFSSGRAWTSDLCSACISQFQICETRQDHKAFTFGHV